MRRHLESILRRWGYVPLARLHPMCLRLMALADYAERSGQLTNHAKARVRRELETTLEELERL